MSVNLRTLGVRGENLPAKKALAVIASDFLIGGLLIDTERRFDKVFKVNNIEEFNQIFGAQINPNDYGADAVKGFFDNASGVDASLYIQSLIGYDTGSSAIDADIAERQKADVGADADAYIVQPAYEDNLQYGEAGNRIGTLFTQIDRFSTQASATCPATGQSYAVLDSVIDVKVGDIIRFKTGVGGATLVHKKVIQVDESAKRVYWTGNFEISGGSGETLAVDDVVVIPGFKVQTYVKTINGVESEVDTELGKIICSSESEVVDYYVENVFKSSKWIKINEGSASLLGNRLPVTDTTIVYCTGGTAGTSVTTAVALNYFLAKFNNQSIRFLGYPESTDETLQKTVIGYSLGRNDNPIVLINIPENRTKSQLITIGQNYQVSDFSSAVIVANWLEVTDPFATSSNAPNRKIPNIGHVMGAWIRCIGQLGIHFIPATDATILRGILAVVGDTMEDDVERTEVARAGVNLIQNIVGTGIKVMNLFTVSTDVAYLFANGILMRNYIKVSGEDSLSSTENTPNSFNRIKASKMAMLTFLYNLWKKGSTGTVSEGETFGQSFNDDGSATTADDHFQVIADITNNPQVNINLGERNIWVYFTYPSPAGSIVIGVGILLRS